ncbi:PAS domain-containing protein [Methylosinus sp. KRF6]|uniref:PAS domain-containing protein n=1 Tax=Methylosinus sp. KRF6 TaxID=2846853 RepID=UPI001C0E318C|nr:PAS domain-containing protein [Methylosinus sp. KRF6]MBU3890912.1 PAS domain-containing protein [Methylosinus sp. KRF6]
MNFTTPDYESFFHAVNASIPSSIFIFDEKLRVVMANQNFLEKSCRGVEQTLGRHLHDVLPVAFRDTPLEQQLRNVISDGATLRRQRMTYRAPGVSTRIYSYNICPLRLRRDFAAAILVMDDVTDLLRLSDQVREMQMHLASVVESAADLIISTNPEGRILTWNAASEQATGFSSNDMYGRPLANLIEAPKNTDVEIWFHEIGQSERRRSAEWPMMCKNGESIPVSWNLSLMTDINGKVTGAVVVGRNLLKQRELEAQVQQAEKLAALGRVIGGIAHEIRNPLGVSSGAAQLLKQRIASPALLDDCVDKIISGIRRASLIVDSLLRFARPSRIRETESVDMTQVLKNAVMFASGEASVGTSIHWDVRGPEESLHAQGVQSLLELVMINLVSNAFQVMPKGGELSILLTAENENVLIEIGDTGAGISEEHISRIFDPFFTTWKDSRRLGLGLSLSHSIVIQHGGSINVRQGSPLGSIFSVRLAQALPPAATALSAQTM